MGVDPTLFYETDGDLTAVATFLNEQSPTDQPIYVAAKYYQPPTVAFLSDAYDAITWLPESKALPLPDTGSALYIFPHTSPLPDWAAPLLASATVIAENDSFTAYQLDTKPDITPPNAQATYFGSAVTLLGYDVEATPAGETMPVTLYWRVDGVPDANYMPFVHLEDRWGYRWSQADAFAYPVAQWSSGEVIVQRVELPVTAGAPLGDYQVRVGFFNPDSGNRLPVLDENGRYAGDSTLIENAPVQVGQPPNPLPQPTNVIGEEVQPGLELLGYQWGSKELSTGESLDISLWWLATAQQKHLSTRLELYKRDNTGRILGTTKPNHGTYPFESWETPQFIIDNLSMPIPDSVTDGEYRIQLHLFDGNDESVYKQDLGWITVTQTERVFEVPEMETAVNSTFGSEINLLGYNLSPNADGYVLDLIWQAQTRPASNYTVFVHALNADGSCCTWQQDAMPRQNTYPTTRWLPDEVITDSYQIILPEGAAPGEYPIEVGLYIAENGTRLQIQNPNGESRDAVYLEPIVVE